MPCRGDANAAGLIFQGWDAAGEGSAAIVYDWERSVLEAVYEAPERDAGATQQTQDLDGEEDDGLRRVGGPVEPTVNEVHMRILLDHSCIEVYLGTGEVLSTRIYRCLSLLAVAHTGSGKGVLSPRRQRLSITVVSHNTLSGPNRI